MTQVLASGAITALSATYLPPPVLVGCAHGTVVPAARRAVAELLLAVAHRRPDLDVMPAFVDVQSPRLPTVLAQLQAIGRRSVVVPLLLSTGYHVRVDIADAVWGVKDAVAAAGLGPDVRLVDVLLTRLWASGARPGDGVVLAAAGSSDPHACIEVEVVRRHLAAHWDGPVTSGFAASTSPTVAEAVQALRRSGSQRVVVASYLLAPGYFHGRLALAGADLVTAPLLAGDGPDSTPDERLVDQVLARYAH